MRKIFQILCLAMAVTATCAAEDDAAGLFAAGEKAARAGDSLQAYLLYSEAARADPGNALYARRQAALRSAAALSRLAVIGVDPAIETVAAQLQTEGIVESRELAAEPPPALEPAPGKQSFDLKGSVQTLFEKVAGAYGIQVTFDAGYAPPSPMVTFRIADATAAEALRALEAATDSFLIPRGAHSAMVARDNQQKRTELMPVMAVAVPIPERLSAQEAQEILTGVQQTLEIRRISLDSVNRVVYFRDIVPKAMAARQMFADLSRGRAQIEVDVEFLSVGKTSNLSYGLSLPQNAAPIIALGKSFQNVPAAVLGSSFFTFGGGATLMGLGIVNSTFFATLSKSEANSLLSSQIVALDGQAATLHVGDRYPITTSSFGSTVAQAQSGAFAPTIQFVDLGLVLKITPTIHEDMEVTLDVDAAFKALGSGSFNGIPVIDSRQYQGKVRLKDGEWAVVAGMLSTTDAETPTGIAGLSDLPWIGGLFTHHVHERDRSETLVVLKPHLVSLPPWEYVTRPMWTGSETRPVSPF
jgi:type II secretory pathway component GspD/PulD (secretin)